MSDEHQRRDPLHGITLKEIVTRLHAHFGWEELGHRIKIRCFTSDPSLNSSLKFLRKTLWAREKVEHLYVRTRVLHTPPPETPPTPQTPQDPPVPGSLE